MKQLLETTIKRQEKGENWLLAKRPFGGNSCASCEAFLGDLTDNREYIPWNKLKETTERLYRLGTGFSHLLQDKVNFNIPSNSKTNDKQQNDLLNNTEDSSSNQNPVFNNTLVISTNNIGTNVNLGSSQHNNNYTGGFNNTVISKSTKLGGNPNASNNTGRENPSTVGVKDKTLPKIRSKVKNNNNMKNPEVNTNFTNEDNNTKVKLNSSGNVNSSNNNLGIVLNTHNISMEIPEFDEQEEEMEVQNTEPKVLKIYKIKNKNANQNNK